MACNLILYTPRSGSMLLSDIMSLDSNTRNLSEAWNINPNEPDLSRINHEAMHRSDTRLFIRYLKEHEKRRNTLKEMSQTDNGWTAKIHVTPALANSKDFLEYCIGSKNVNVWLTHRVNLADQFLSLINAGYRQTVLKEDGGGFVHTNKTKIATYTSINWSRSQIFNTLNSFLLQIIMWRNVFDLYRNNISVVSYEKVIKPASFDSLGMKEDTMTKYYRMERHFVPTRNNVKKFDVPGVWEECEWVLNKHQHLVEV